MSFAEFFPSWPSLLSYYICLLHSSLLFSSSPSSHLHLVMVNYVLQLSQHSFRSNPWWYLIRESSPIYHQNPHSENVALRLIKLKLTMLLSLDVTSNFPFFFSSYVSTTGSSGWIIKMFYSTSSLLFLFSQSLLLSMGGWQGTRNLLLITTVKTGS